MTTSTLYRERVLAELNTVPDEYLPFVLQLLRSFHNAVLLKGDVVALSERQRPQGKLRSPLSWEGNSFGQPLCGLDMRRWQPGTKP